MSTYVLDASIILKWVLPKNISPLQEQALSIREALVDGTIKIIVPSLWRYEVANTLGRLVPNHAFDLLTLCSDIGIQEAEESSERDKIAFDLMNQWQVSFYDASFHALAIVNDIIFITADEKYKNKVKEQSDISILKDWQK